jgi:hypothetical protein
MLCHRDAGVLTAVVCARARLQDMAAFGYTDGSSRDQSGSIPVHL